MNAVEYLLKARDLIADPVNWTQGKYIDSKGRMCAMGAIYQIAGNNMIPSAEVYLYRASGQLSVVDINDKQGHAAVMDLYNKAIKLAMEDDERQGRGFIARSPGQRVENTEATGEEGRSLSGERKALQTV